MSFLKPEPPPPEPEPSLEDPQAKRKEQEELRKLRTPKGRRATMITGGLLGEAPTERKTLLGS